MPRYEIQTKVKRNLCNAMLGDNGALELTRKESLYRKLPHVVLCIVVLPSGRPSATECFGSDREVGDGVRFGASWVYFEQQACSRHKANISKTRGQKKRSMKFISSMTPGGSPSQSHHSCPVRAVGLFAPSTCNSY